jgi:uncharacterized protein YciI
MTPRSLVPLILTAFLGFSGAATAQSPVPSPTAETPAGKAKFEFDKFMVVLLVRPPDAPDLQKDQLEKLQEGHMSNMRTLADAGKLLKAGPTEDFTGRNVRGIFILTTESVDQAREWISNDPLIKAGRLMPEFLKWYVEKGSLK